MTADPKFIDAGSSGEWGWHATELAMRCPRLFAYHHRIPGALASEGDRAPLLKGSLVHQGLAHHYRRKQCEQEGDSPTAWATPDVAIEHCAHQLGPAADQYVALAQKVVREYQLHWLHENVEVLHVEDVFTAQVGGFKFTQRLDLVVRDADGKVYIWDHKTTGRLSGASDRYTLSGQFLGMATFGRDIWGDEFGGVKINFIEVPSMLAAPCKFERVDPDPAPSALKSFPLTVLTARQRIADLDASGLAPTEWPMALSEQTCMTAYGRCAGYHVCRWGTDPRPALVGWQG
jgi:hypothetical protein